MLNKDGDDHRRLRRLVTASFTPRMVEQLRPRIEGIAQELIDAVAPRGEMDLVEKLPSRCRSRSSCFRLRTSLELVRADPSLMPRAIEELLRLRRPAVEELAWRPVPLFRSLAALPVAWDT
jgi:cytochrome P450